MVILTDGLLVLPAGFRYQSGRKMKSLLVWAFFVGCTAVMAAGIALAVNGKGVWLMAVSFLAYIALFIKFGCLPSAH